MNINLIMAEFGENRKNCGGGDLSKFNRLDPALSSMLEFFPDLKLTIYTDFDMKVSFSNVEIKDVKSIFDKKQQRYGNRCNDYYKVLGLLESKYEIAICIDSDMSIYSEHVESIIPLVKKFGICIPANPRLLVRVDGVGGADGNYNLNEDETSGAGFAYNMSPISFYTKNERARELLNCYCDEMKTNPVRGPLAMWRAVWETGINPYVLPFQWCVCKEHVGIGNEIILHIGHEKVKKYYNGEHNEI